jgi:hypothetical protein
MKFFPAACFALLTLAVGAEGQTSPRPDPESHFLRLRNGSLVESVYFRNAWLKEHPTEDAIVIPEESQRDGQTHVSAICAYTRRAAVFVHSAESGTVALPGAPADLLTRPVELLGTYRHLLGFLPAPSPAVTGDGDAQLRRAYAALHDPDIMGDFPVAVSPLASRVTAADGTTGSQAVDWLIFDWNGGHYGYHPGVGTIRQAVPIDPLTNRPFLCVALGDLVEGVIFCAEFRKAHPEEKAVLLFVPDHAAQGENTGGTAVAAFTRKGSLYFHSLFFGDIPLAEHGRTFTAVDLADPPRLYRAYKSYLWGRFVAACAAKHRAVPESREIHHGGREIVDLLGTREPRQLAGDTPALQIRRVFQRAQALGLSSEVATEADPDDPAARSPCLVLCWNVSEYIYVPARGAHYGVETDATVLPNRLIDGILFSSRYRRDHPQETALAIPYRESGGGKWKAVTVYTQAGAVWLHNPETGESALPGYAPRDLANPAKFKSIRTDGNRLLKAEAIRRIKEKSARLNLLPLDRTADAGELDPRAVAAQLQAAGVSSRLAESTRERDAAGTVRTYPVPSLTFEWWGVTYTYGPDHFCTATDGFVALP